MNITLYYITDGKVVREVKLDGGTSEALHAANEVVRLGEAERVEIHVDNTKWRDVADAS